MEKNDKQKLRVSILKIRNEMSSSERKEKSSKISDNILISDIFKDAKIIFTYVNMNSEVETIPFIELVFKMGKRIAVPIAPKNREMYFVEILSLSELFKTKIGLLEPKKDKSEEIVPSNKDLFLMPASVFDVYGNRIGYGAGYYDRYLENKKEVKKIGLAFDFQIAKEKLPNEKFDIHVNEIVTEKRWIVNN